MSALITLPDVPTKHADFISHIASNPDKKLPELLEPYKQYDAKLREVFAQEPNHPALNDQYLNVVPLFNGGEKHLKIRARDLENESVKEKERYVMPLNDEDRRPDGSPAIVQDIKEFQQNFALFCESSLVDLDWSNVVAAGSSVVTCLLPVPEKHKKSKKALRQYYHEMIAPASDVDLFIYGLSEEDAVKKIVQIEQQIKEAILEETTTIRTKNAITIASQYPTRHIQIVLRIYKSPAEILTGFDVDCSCAAYDGKQVYTAPRALTAYMTQTNTIDLTRRSPSYENRLSKYSHRGFEVYWPLLDRSKIDPTIFERNFGRTVGLARLLVLERLPTKSEREAYMDERRRERGRPAINRFRYFSMQDNIKDRYEDEVAEWVDAEDVSDYHTFTIPYGPKYNAKKIEKLLYTKDLLLNSEWNKPDDREVDLHRHPAFFGYATDVIRDCCGFCPKPVTPEEHDVAEEESKVYVSGEVSFIKDDPGRQAIGSFHPLTDDDWTDMAYVGNTARLCQAIIDGDAEHVEDWLSQEGADPNCRDYTGRTPLQLAVTSSTTDIVKALIDHNARLVARLADGRTALHLAAARGNVEMVKMIMQRSEQNEEEEAKKEDIRKQARMAAREGKSEPMEVDGDTKEDRDEDSDIEMVDEADSDEDMHSTTTGSYVKVKDDNKKGEELLPEDEEEDEPDVYDVNVLTWDTQCSPLHYAILNGNIGVVKTLVQDFGADVLLPVKLLNSHDKSPRGAILTLVLALKLPLDQAKAMTQALLEIGASSAQADMKQATALHYISGDQPRILETLFQFDEPAAKRAINHLAVTGSSWSPSAQSPLMSAILRGNSLAALKLLEAGSAPSVDFNSWIKSTETQDERITTRDSKQNHNDFVRDVEQPVMLAVQTEMTGLVMELLARGADPNTLPKETQRDLLYGYNQRGHTMQSLLDVVRGKIQNLRRYKDEKPPAEPEYKLKEGADYLDGIQTGTYKDFVAKVKLEETRVSDKQVKETWEKRLKEYNERKGIAEKQEAIDALAAEFEQVEKELVAKGAKTFQELHPEKVVEKDDSHRRRSHDRETPPFGIEFDFKVHDLTDETREAYLKLFQAAWDGDLDTIKSLTLVPWGPSSENTPLKIAVEDRNDQNPFSLAVLRNHLDVARAIVEISFAQYQPNTEQPKARYRLRNENEDEDEDEFEDQDGDSDDIQVYREIVDAKFTIENIGEVSKEVKSKVSPSAFMSWSCSAWAYKRLFSAEKKFTYGLDDHTIEGTGYTDLLSWAIIANDMELFRFLTDLDVEWTHRLGDKSESSTGVPSFYLSDFNSAIKYGRLEMLADMIRLGGAGMELESLVQKSGVKFHERPKYYQGLSVHGRKRADWVSAARGTQMSSVSHTNPPLLQAAFKGSVSSVEWFLSDTPKRHYQAFAESYKDHKLIKHLNTKGGGFDKVLSKWLGARRELALHCAVMAPPRLESLKLIQYLLKTMPEAVEARSDCQYTPLSLAFSLRRFDAARILIEAGANQTVRDHEGDNILHLLLSSTSKLHSSSAHAEHIKTFLDLVDQRLIPSLLIERSAASPGSLTPLACWLRQASYSESKESEDMLRMLLGYASSYGNNEHLEMLDGSGETPVHTVVKNNQRVWLKVMLEFRPDLLYRENSVGRTPYELVQDSYIAASVSSPPYITTYNSVSSIVNRDAASFVKDKEGDEHGHTESTWRICDNFMKEHPGKRRLVSLMDANEVAKRLANRHGHKAHQKRADEESNASSVAGDADEGSDEVNQWYWSSARS